MSNRLLFGAMLSDSIFPRISRLLISAIFVEGALRKIMGGSGQASYVQSHQSPAQLIPALPGIALSVEVVGVLCLVVGWESPRCSIRNVPLFGHGERAVTQLLGSGRRERWWHADSVPENVAIMGGLLTISASGPGKWSLDR
jgi:putative oxidoreductase